MSINMGRRAALSCPFFRVIAGMETAQITIRILRCVGLWGMLRSILCILWPGRILHLHGISAAPFHHTMVLAGVVVVEIIAASNAGSFLLHFDWPVGAGTIGMMGHDGPYFRVS